nr:molybdopterin-guanine dinucleotide biosynthesis protein B [Candidatus Sigynarchaeota archaeon]
MASDNVLFVVGKHDVGKTTFVEKLLPVITKRDFSVGVIKDIHIEGFSIDQEGKDTWRHWKAGAAIVVARGIDETDILVKWRMALDEIEPAMESVDIVIAEGFKELHGRKVIVAKAEADYAEMEQLLSNEDDVWGVAGPLVETGKYRGAFPALASAADLEAIADKLDPVAKQARLRRNRLKMPLESFDCALAVDGQRVQMKPYVAETLKNVLVGAIAALHWNTKETIKRVDVVLGRGGPGEKWTVDIRLGQNIISLKEFVQQSIASVVAGYVATLSMPRDVSVAACKKIDVAMQ